MALLLYVGRVISKGYHGRNATIARERHRHPHQISRQKAKLVKLAGELPSEIYCKFSHVQSDERKRLVDVTIPNRHLTDV